MVPLSTVLSGLGAWGVVAGLGLGFGLWSLLSALPRARWPRLEARLVPHLLDVSAAARAEVERARVRAPLLGALFGPAPTAARDVLLRWLGGETSVALRLRQAGSHRTVMGFRLRQGAAAGAGALLGATVCGWVASTRPLAAAAWIALIAVGGGGGVLGWDLLLSRAAAGRLARLREELPTVAELMALSLSAGEGVYDAVRRVARASSGELGVELRAVVTDVGVGIPLAEALERMSRALALAPLSRLIEAMSAALERGAPLAEVLRAQAGDARSERKRELLEEAGRKEVLMLVPLVFGLLPLTVVIAVFPGVFILRSGL
ncbi:MAG TPA: type II secretion system F family protein [Gryllotalpicola sp.]